MTVYAVLLILLSCSARAAVFYVVPNGNDQKDGTRWATAKRTIQAGINIAVRGDEVWVAAGTYYERITLKDGVALYGGFKGDEKTRDQRNFAAFVSKIDGQKAGTVVTVRTGSCLSTAIDGFTITNGIGSPQGDYRYGGGIYALDADVTVANNIIIANSAYTGAGVYGNRAVVMSNNVVRDNVASLNGGGALLMFGPITVQGNTFTSNKGAYGGGLALAYARGQVSGNTFLTNNAQVGGGAYNAGSFHPTISGNTFKSNTAYFGAGVGCNGGYGEVVANVFTANSALLSGGGVYLYSGSTSTVANNVLTGGAAQCGFGGAVASKASNPRIVNNTMVGNTAAYGGGGVAFVEEGAGLVSNNIIALGSSGVYGDSGTRPTLRTNAFHRNAGGDFAGVSPGAGNVTADPAFIDQAAGNLRLRKGSPCVDAGTNADAPASDFDGVARPLDGVGSGTATVDLGAFESPAGVVAYDMKIGDVKSTYADGSTVGFTRVTVTASFPASGYIYVQGQDRSAGIRVDTASSFTEGQIVNVTGTLRTDPDNGERCVVAVEGSPVLLGTSVPVDAVLMSHENLGGARFGMQQGIAECISLNNVGLLVDVWGRVSSVQQSANTFTLWTGAVYTEAGRPVVDPAGNLGVQVLVKPGSSLPGRGQFVRLQGVSTTVRSTTGQCPRVLLSGSIALLGQ